MASRGVSQQLLDLVVQASAVGLQKLILLGQGLRADIGSGQRVQTSKPVTFMLPLSTVFRS